jgi:hypothetical protein
VRAEPRKLCHWKCVLIRTFPLIFGGEHAPEIRQKHNTLIVSQPMDENVVANCGGDPDGCLLCYNS